MHETADDLRDLQAVLERSFADAGEHLREVITPERRLDAEELTARLTGMRLLVLAPVTADCRPIAGPVDGIFYRGAFHFGSSPASVRFRHIRRRPWVSASHVHSEELAVTVHGQAVPIDVSHADHAGFRQTLLDVYVPRYGAQWEQFLESGPVDGRIEATRLYTISMPGP